jgi:hypothetical protein
MRLSSASPPASSPTGTSYDFVRTSKQAAIAQGVDIQLTFQLSVRYGGHYQVVGDTDTVRVHRHQDFLCVDRDDNS